MTETLTDLFCGAGGSGQGAHHVPGLDTVVDAVVIAAVVIAVGVAVVRREMRIRARLADTDGLRYWPCTPGGAPEPRVGPGEHAPVLPAPTGRPARALTVVPDPIPARPIRAQGSATAGGAS